MLKSRDIARTLIDEVIAHPEKEADILETLSEFLASKNLTELAPQIIEAIEKERNSREEENVLIIRSATDLSEKQLADIREFTGADKDARLEVSVEEKLVSGFVTRYKGKRYDATGKGYLHTLETALVQ